MGEVVGRGRNGYIQTSVFQYTILYTFVARENPILLLWFAVVHIRMHSLWGSKQGCDSIN